MFARGLAKVSLLMQGLIVVVGIMALAPGTAATHAAIHRRLQPTIGKHVEKTAVTTITADATKTVTTDATKITGPVVVVPITSTSALSMQDPQNPFWDSMKSAASASKASTSSGSGKSSPTPTTGASAKTSSSVTSTSTGTQNASSIATNGSSTTAAPSDSATSASATPTSSSAPAATTSQPASSNNETVPLAVGVSIGGTFAAVAGVIGFLLFRKRRRENNFVRAETPPLELERADLPNLATDDYTRYPQYGAQHQDHNQRNHDLDEIFNQYHQPPQHPQPTQSPPPRPPYGSPPPRPSPSYQNRNWAGSHGHAPNENHWQKPYQPYRPHTPQRSAPGGGMQASELPAGYPPPPDGRALGSQVGGGGNEQSRFELPG